MLTEKHALALLKKHSTTTVAYKKIVAHSKAVQKCALSLAKNHPKADRSFIATAALLHDIGRFACPPHSKENAIWHGVVGARILRKEKLPKYALLVERHVGSGITKIEARKYGLPVKSYLPRSIEEKIVCYADSLIFRTRRGTLQEVLDRYHREVGISLVKRTEKLAREIEQKH